MIVEKKLVISPLLLQYDSSKSAFLKTDWSAGGMGYILMQTNDSPQSVAAVKFWKTNANVLLIYPLMVRDYDQYSLVHDSTNLSKYTTTPLSEE